MRAGAKGGLWAGVARFELGAPSLSCPPALFAVVSGSCFVGTEGKVLNGVKFARNQYLEFEYVVRGLVPLILQCQHAHNKEEAYIYIYIYL